MAKATKKATKGRTTPKAIARNAKSAKVNGKGAKAKNGKAKAPKAKRARLPIEFAREKALTPNWKAKDVAKARATRHGVSCVHKGKTTHHSSLWGAFQDLGLAGVKDDGSYWGATSQHQTFRKALKLARRLPLTLNGKTYNFATSKGE